MVARRRLVRAYVFTVVVSVIAFTLAYDAGMTLFENRPRSLLESFEFVMQTLTTTGYGQDAPWGTAMTVLVVGIQVASLVLIFAAFPIVIVPLVEDALATSPPTELEDVRDHVLICHHSARTETLLDELGAREVPAVVVEPDRETATDLHDLGVAVVHGDPESPAALRRTSVEAARAVVADGDDDVDLSVVMAVREVASDLPVYTIVDDPAFATYHDHAGANEAFSPRTLLGNGLANKLRTAVSTDLNGGIEIGEDFQIAELPIQPGGELRGVTVAESNVEKRTGVKIIGAWSNGEFRTPPFPGLTLAEHTVLLVAGGDAGLDRLRGLTRGVVRSYRRGEVLVAGHGVVGSTVAKALTEADIPRTVIDRIEHPSVDVAGDATDPETLRRANIENARTVVLALDNDTTTLLATFVIRDLAPAVEIIARVEEPENVRKLYRAGADYVLSLASVTGRLLASRIIADEEVVSFEGGIEVVRVPAEPVSGRTLSDLSIRERTGCTVVAIERRDGRVKTNPGDWIELGTYDHLVLAGTDRDVARFGDAFQ